MIINAGNFTLLNGNSTTKTMTILPQETVELVCYNDATHGQVLLVLGKAL